MQSRPASTGLARTTLGRIACGALAVSGCAAAGGDLAHSSASDVPPTPAITSSETVPDGPVRSPDLFQDAPSRPDAVSLFYALELGPFTTGDEARAAAEDLPRHIHLTGIETRITETPTNAFVSLGPLMSPEAGKALCEQLEPVVAGCRLSSPESARPVE